MTLTTAQMEHYLQHHGYAIYITPNALCVVCDPCDDEQGYAIEDRSRIAAIIEAYEHISGIRACQLLEEK